MLGTQYESVINTNISKLYTYFGPYVVGRFEPYLLYGYTRLMYVKAYLSLKQIRQATRRRMSNIQSYT